MPFNATVDIFINFSYVQVRFLNRQGFLSYRTRIFYKDKQKQINCRPYNIVRGPKQNNEVRIQSQTELSKQSEIDEATQHYYSRVIPVRYRPDDYYQNETVFFKTYIDTDRIQLVNFECEIECLFSDKNDGQFDIIGSFKGKIHRVHNISTFMPISFDEFEGFVICSTFHSTIMEFKYSFGETEGTKVNNFWYYLKTVTKEFDRDKLYKFYLSYRDFLEKQLEAIQQRHLQIHTKFKTKQIYKKIEIPRDKPLERLISDKSLKSHTVILTSSQEEIINKMIADYSKFKNSIYQKWMNFSHLISENSQKIADCYRKQYQHECQDRFKNNVFSHRISNNNWMYSKYDDSGRTSLEKAFAIKKYSIGDGQMWADRFPIEKLEHFGKAETNIKMFEQIYTKTSQKADRYPVKNKRHIIILVHGFQACKKDFILFKNCLEVNYGVQVLISACNQGLTDNSILLAGKRLANQVSKTLTNFKKQFRLSFIGHSMGGLIIRAAIPDLKEFQSKFYTYMSLSSPHLGYLYQSSTLIKAGLWVLNNVQKCDSLLEMSMQDQSDFRKTTLYKLAFNKSLEQFRQVCFLCSCQDQYVVYESARVELNKHLMGKMKQQKVDVARQMVEGMIGGKMNTKEISRINVVFNIDEICLDSIMGRTGHIKFLSDIQFIREFCACFDKFFL